MPPCIADDEQRSPARKATGPTWEIKVEAPLVPDRSGRVPAGIPFGPEPGGLRKVPKTFGQAMSGGADNRGRGGFGSSRRKSLLNSGLGGLDNLRPRGPRFVFLMGRFVVVVRGSQRRTDCHA